MAKSQKRNGREPKKPKTAAKKTVAPASVFDAAAQSPKKKGGAVTP